MGHANGSETTVVLSDADSLALLRRFSYTKLLNEGPPSMCRTRLLPAEFAAADTSTRSIALLGTFAQAEDGDDVPALLSIERQAFETDEESLRNLVQRLAKAKNLLINDIYHLFLGWSSSGDNADSPAGALCSKEALTREDLLTLSDRPEDYLDATSDREGATTK